jgi:hypothetical protein
VASQCVWLGQVIEWNNSASGRQLQAGLFFLSFDFFVNIQKFSIAVIQRPIKANLI